MSIENRNVGAEADNLVDSITAATQAIDLILSLLADGLDHPEIWPLIPDLTRENPDFIATLYYNARNTLDPRAKVRLCVLIALTDIQTLSAETSLEKLLPIATDASQSVQVQGAVFYVESLIDPDNPKFKLDGRICLKPFTELNILERSTHLCCASWLPTSNGDLSKLSTDQVWNGPAAQAIRASIFDGSYRFCNKRTCPSIQEARLPATEEIKATAKWAQHMETKDTIVPTSPEMVNLSYDRTCNLSCPSCRVTRYAADDATRKRYDDMQEQKILPMLKQAESVYITGSGDPFSSKNFRNLMSRLSVEDYPNLKFIMMTNGMLLTPMQWEAFPSLHRRVESMHISLDAATGSTHEHLRRGAQWPIMEKNLAFAAELYRDGAIENLCLSFTVQQENFREMGDVVDLAHAIGANRIHFGLITNWGTFSADEYRRKAVFNKHHPEYGDFIRHMQDPRLRDPIVVIGNLKDFILPVSSYACDNADAMMIANPVG